MDETSVHEQRVLAHPVAEYGFSQRIAVDNSSRMDRGIDFTTAQIQGLTGAGSPRCHLIVCRLLAVAALFVQIYMIP
jgi:hypothetical protein